MKKNLNLPACKSIKSFAKKMCDRPTTEGRKGRIDDARGSSGIEL